MGKNKSTSGVAVMASLTDFGLTNKESRGVVIDPALLPNSLQGAQAALRRYGNRIGASLEGNSRMVAASILQAQTRVRPVAQVNAEHTGGAEPEM